MVTPLLVDDVRNFRTRYWWLQVGLVAGMGFLPTGYGVAVLGLASENAKGDPMPMGIRVGSFVACAVVAALVALMARASFSVSPDGIVVRNVFKTHRLAWSDVRRAAVTLRTTSGHGSATKTRVGAISLTVGTRVIRASATTCSWESRGRALARPADALRSSPVGLAEPGGAA